MPTHAKCSTNVPTHTRPIQPPGTNTLNAILPRPPTPTELAETRARHLAVCQELIALGMQMTRIAAAQATQAHEERSAALPPSGRAPAGSDPNLNFARQASGVRHAMVLENKILNNAFTRQPAPEPQPCSIPAYLQAALADACTEEPDLPPYSIADQGNLYEAVSNLALLRPENPQIPDTLEAVIEETLLAHPDAHLSENFARVCGAFAITPDRKLLQPHLESQFRPPQNLWHPRE